MKKSIRYLVFLIIISGAFLNRYSFGQLVIFPSGNKPDTTAFVDQVYQFKDTAITDFAKYPITYTLVEGRPGMVIGSTTGIISWTPASISDGGKVIVKATNNSGDTARHEFHIYVSDGIPCPDGIEAYWKLDETSGTTYYDTIGINDATASVNPPKDTAGIVDRAKAFNPLNNEGLSVPADDIFNWATDESFSVEFWIKNEAATFDSVSVIIGRNEGGTILNVHWWFGFMTDNTLNFIVRKDAGDIAQCQCPLSDTEWHHVVGIRDAVSNKIKLYVDKNFVSEDDYDGSGPGLVSALNPLTIGYLQPDPGLGKRYPYNGTVDDVKLYGKALSSAEITTSYNKGFNNKPACQEGNFAPLFITDPKLTVNEDSPYTYSFTAKDIDAGDLLEYTVDNKPAWLNYNETTRTFSGTPGNDQVGGYLMLINVTDSKVIVDHNYTLTVTNVNDPPEITSTPVIQIDEEQPYSYQVTASDIDAGDNLEFTTPVKPAWLSINASTGVLSGTPPENDSSAYDVTVRVTDDSSAYAEQSFNIDIRNINDPPVISGHPPLDTDEDQSLTVTLDDIYYQDPDDGQGELTITLKNGMNYTHTGNLITPEANYHGIIKVPFDLSDGEYTDSDTLNITVNSVNDTPVITSTPVISVNEDMSYLYTIAVADNDPEDVVILSGIIIPDWLTLDPTAKTLSGTPDNDQVGYSPDSSFVVRLNVTDGKQDSTQTFILTVHNVNDAPVINSQLDTITSYPDSTVMLQLSDVDVSDVDNKLEDMSFIIHDGNGYTVTGDVITIDHDATGLVNLNIRVTDGTMASDIFTFAVKIDKVNATERNLMQADIIGRVYPNPASEFVKFERNLNQEMIFELTNLQGQTVMRKELDADTGVFEVEVSGLPSGIYFYRFFDAAFYETGKLSVEK